MNSGVANAANGASGSTAISRETVYMLQNDKMNIMKKSLSNIGRFFYQPLTAETLGFFRIAVSAFALIQFLILFPDWMLLYGPKGILPWQVTDTLATSYMPSMTTIMKLLSVFNLSAEELVKTITAIYFFSLVGLLLGYRTRIMAVLAWLSHLTLNTTGHFTAYGVETFLHIALFYCVILPVNCSWSIDTKRREIKVPAHLITLSIRIIQLHLCIMYCASGLEKAMGIQWWNGEAIWIAMQQDQFNQVNIDWMANASWVPKLLCWGTLTVEILFPFGMLWRKTKKLWLISILSMHLFIAIFLGLHLFGALMLLLNAAAFGEHCFTGMLTRRRKKWWRYQVQYNKNNIGEVFNPL
jgi:hypothetical protein